MTHASTRSMALASGLVTLLSVCSVGVQTARADEPALQVKVSYAGKLVMSAEVDFSISENPNFRFYFVADGGGQLEAKAVDNEDLEFETSVRLGPDRGGGEAFTLR